MVLLKFFEVEYKEMHN